MADKGKVIVTGGAGFIGSHTVVELALAGYSPVIVDDFSNSQRSVLAGLEKILGHEVPCHAVDCNDGTRLSEIFSSEGPIQGVIHFAAFKSVGESVHSPLKYYRNNVGSTTTLLEVMKAHSVWDLVFSSSCTVYGQPDSLPVTEESPMKHAESPYGSTKQICERLIADLIVAEHPVRAAVLRYFNPIGAHPSGEIGELPLGTPDNLVPFITQTAAGSRNVLTVFGDDYATPDGSCIRDYIHVLDLAQAHVKALDWLAGQPEKPAQEIFNIGTGSGASVLEAIAAFERASGKSLTYTIGARRPGDIEQIYANADKSEKLLGWKATRGLEEAMRDAWNWQVTLDGRSAG
jgi:UDP-glucose 4-epimerase